MDDLSISGAAPSRSPQTFLSLLVKRAAIVLTVSLAAAGLAYVALLSDRYQATATIELPHGAAYPPQEVARMLSQPVLALAVERLPSALIAELRQTASDTVDITALLQRSVQVRQTADAGTVRLLSVASDATSALGLANGLAGAYLAIASGDTAPPPEPAEQRLMPDPRSPMAPLAAVDAQTQALRDRMAAASQARIALENRADLAGTLLDQENFYALAREFDSDSTMVNRVQQRADLQSERDKLAATLLPSHPKMRILDERIATLSRQLGDDGRQMAEAARAAIAAARQTETALKAQLDSLSDDAVQAGPDSAALAGSIAGAPGRLISVSVAPQQKLLPPAPGAGVSGALALMARFALLLRRPQSRGAYAQPVDATAPGAGQGDEEPSEALVPDIIVTPGAEALAFYEDDPAAWAEDPASKSPRGRHRRDRR